MAVGLGVLRLSPAHFWSLTPRELEAAVSGGLGPRAHAAPPDRSALERLMARHPDRPGGLVTAS